ncbi:hypothetical protein CEN50_02315 [Fischerella thermalis CCMEE 5268]|uniref:Uncharacterized protein n=1 Tax=Fischerella thermalis CCMEE 5268 TaxID=2019662 RepID=A0A2N6KLK6_9CYAN|nr:hypothetical protein [Fischerella thermalis]PMB00729.1 hypothetical protein CEN50_02315 [Fischerella thermalis CCMEE 5268]
MPNPKGNPKNLQPLSTDREQALTKTLTIRVDETTYQEVKSKDNPAEFCREAIREKLDREKKENF